ncbi:MAG TPA: hypothetical protein DEP84_20560 [Chloroflexi bacterium]|nr:hypothetical protein [Chloroflexota bacterium]
MDKGIGFNRNIYLSWLDATAALCSETDDPAQVRARLEPVVGQDIHNADNRRKAIDILINIWVKTGSIAPDLRNAAVRYFETGQEMSDRLWLHYGLALLYYSFFREGAAAIGQLSRSEDAITPAMVKRRLVAERGELGSLEKAVERIIFSLRDWGVLEETSQRYAYAPQRKAFSTTNAELEAWLLACALEAHPAEELVFSDLLRLPELFPFRFTLTVDSLRQHPRFAVHRQGSAWDVVGVATPQVVEEREGEILWLSRL